MKLLLAALVLCAPLANASSISVDITNSGGKLVAVGSDLRLAFTEVTGITVNGVSTVGDLGSMFFGVNNLISGSFANGGVFAAGGRFEIDGNGALGTHTGNDFIGTFSEPVDWTLVTLKNGNHEYVLTGVLTGKWWNGQTINGATVQLVVGTGKGFFGTTARISSGDTSLQTTVPEPASLAYMLTGVGGIAYGYLRKFVSRTARAGCLRA